MTAAPGTAHLVFAIEAPLASWGDIAVGEMRPSRDRPTRSCLAGLIAACLGVRRGAEGELQALDALRFAVRVDEAGVPIHDYHTVQVPRSQKGVRHRTRRDELEWERRRDLGTILSTRAYRMEVRARVVVVRSEPAGNLCPTLERIAEAMNEPAFAPFLGRRTCPLAAPLFPVVVSAETFEEAEERYAAQRTTNGCEASRRRGRARWYWEEGCFAPFEAHRQHQVNDRCVSHGGRLFAQRTEYEAVVEVGGAGGGDVSE